jgi:hypothetical protein
LLLHIRKYIKKKLKTKESKINFFACVKNDDNSSWNSILNPKLI